MAARRVILTCEEIVTHEEILTDPNRTVIPGFVVSRVVHEPFASHASPTQDYVGRDDYFFFDYHKQSRSMDESLRWLDNWVLGIRDHSEFLQRLGQKRVANLKPRAELLPLPVNFGL